MKNLKDKGDAEKPGQAAIKKTPFWGKVREAISSLDVTDESLQRNLLDPSKRRGMPTSAPGIPSFGAKYRKPKKKIDLKKVKARRKGK